MKKLVFIILSWYLFTNASDKTDEYVVFYEDDKSIHKCKREDYLEMMEMFEMYGDQQDYKNYLKWELEDKFDNRREKVVYY